MGRILIVILIELLRIYTYVIIVSALLSWASLPPTNRLVQFLRFVTEPVLSPCRQLLYRILPFSWRRIDLSPILAILIIQFVMWLLSLVYSIA